MTPQEFCYWLQGRAELLPDQPPTEAEWKMIREHLALVFKKVTPPLTRFERDQELYEKQLRELQDKKFVPDPAIPPFPYDPLDLCRRSIPSRPLGGSEIIC